jgi:hypothetical protein
VNLLGLALIFSPVFVLLAVNRNRRRRSAITAATVAVEVDDQGARRTLADGRQEEITWPEVTEVDVFTTRKGPHKAAGGAVVLYGTAERGCVIPLDQIETSGLLVHIGRLEGFRVSTVIDALRADERREEALRQARSGRDAQALADHHGVLAPARRHRPHPFVEPSTPTTGSAGLTRRPRPAPERAPPGQTPGGREVGSLVQQRNERVPRRDTSTRGCWCSRARRTGAVEAEHARGVGVDDAAVAHDRHPTARWAEAMVPIARSTGPERRRRCRRRAASPRPWPARWRDRWPSAPPSGCTARSRSPRPGPARRRVEAATASGAAVAGPAQRLDSAPGPRRR